MVRRRLLSSPVLSHWSAVTGSQPRVLSRRSSVTGPRLPVLSHRSSVTGHQSPASSGPRPPTMTAGTPEDSFKRLLADFPAVVNASKSLPCRPSGDVEHHINTKGPPLSCRFRLLDGEKRAAAKGEFLHMEKEDIIRRSNSPWSSSLHMVRKLEGSWRPCGDYRRLNLVTVPHSYPLPNMLDFQERIAGCTIFSKVDLRKGYHQILIHPGDIPKTAIAIPFGLFKFLRMTFGLRNAGNMFQRLMDRILASLDFVFVYLDDVIIGSCSMREHLQHLWTLFQRLQAAGLVNNREKCVFGVPIAVPAKRFNHVHLDLVGPLPVAADGSTYLLTMVSGHTASSRMRCGVIPASEPRPRRTAASPQPSWFSECSSFWRPSSCTCAGEEWSLP